MKRKELKENFKQTMLKKFYTYEKDNYLFIIEKLSFNHYGLLTNINANKKVETYLDRLTIKYNNIIRRTYVEDNEVALVFNHKCSIEEFKNIIDLLITFFKENNYHMVCHNCDNHHPKLILNDESIDIYCENCFNKLKPVHHVSSYKGIISALLYCIIPMLIWIFLHDIGYLIVIDGILFGICSFFGYIKLGYHMDKKGMILSLLSSYIMLFISQIFTYAITIKEIFNVNLKINITLVQSFIVMPDFILDREVIGVSLIYLSISMVLTLISYVVLYKIYKKQHKYMNVFKKL